MTIGILLTNTGTPDAPTSSAVRRYLREFLSDKRIVQLPRLVWLPILYGLVLPLRPRRSAALYQKIWTPDGSPMRVHMQAIATRLREKLSPFPVELGMNYGTPSIEAGLIALERKGCDKIIMLPLFPQYSNTSTGSSLDSLFRALKKLPSEPQVAFISEYAEESSYIEALAASVHQSWDKHGRAEHLLISFHGIPERLVKDGDPYQSHTEATAALLAKRLLLTNDQWTLCYQSQFGYDKWLKPSTQKLFQELPARGIKNIDIVCPGFSVDCLETLEEIAMTGKEAFLEAGGESLRYIPALNASPQQVDLLAEMIKKQISHKDST